MANVSTSFGYNMTTATAMPMSCPHSLISSVRGNLCICEISVISIIGIIISLIKLSLIAKRSSYFRLCTLC